MRAYCASDRFRNRRKRSVGVRDRKPQMSLVATPHPPPADNTYEPVMMRAAR
jgi:hypothetical protein